MKKIFRFLYRTTAQTVIFIAVIVIALIFGIYKLSGSLFWSDFLSNALATFVGIIIGIPVAILLSEFQERASESEKKNKILTLIEKELLVNQVQLSGWKKSGDKQKEALTLHTLLKTELWRAFSDGGELEWIKNPNLLDTISEAYFSVKSVQILSERYFELRMLSNPKSLHWAELDLFSNLEKAVEYAEEVFLETFTSIKKEIY